MRNQLLASRTLQVVRQSLYAAAITLAATAGCADVTPVSGPGADLDDTTAPEVMSTLPAAQATAVSDGTKIIVTFSEAMDPATVESAYASPQLPIDAVSLSWSDDLTVLTISPDQALLYAAGIGLDPSSVQALVYEITISSEAKDLMGNALATPLELKFATKRRMTASFPLDSTLTRVANGGTLLGSSNDIWAGDNAIGNTYRAFITFDLSALHQSAVIESAEFASRQLAAVGSPYTALGPVVAEHVSFANLNNFGSISAMSLAGTYSEDPISESKLIDVSAEVADDIAQRAVRNSRTQYQLKISLATNGDAIADRAVFAKDTFELTTIYIVD